MLTVNLTADFMTILGTNLYLVIDQGLSFLENEKMQTQTNVGHGKGSTLLN